jgi:hypothetical protein
MLISPKAGSKLASGETMIDDPLVELREQVLPAIVGGRLAAAEEHPEDDEEGEGKADYPQHSPKKFAAGGHWNCS